MRNLFFLWIKSISFRRPPQWPGVRMNCVDKQCCQVLLLKTSYCLSQEYQSSRLYLLGYIKGWGYCFLGLWNPFGRLPKKPITFCFNAYSIIKIFSFFFGELLGWQGILFLIVFPQHHTHLIMSLFYLNFLDGFLLFTRLSPNPWYRFYHVALTYLLASSPSAAYIQATAKCSTLSCLLSMLCKFKYSSKSRMAE